MSKNPPLKRLLLIAFTVITALSASCVVEPNIPYDEYPIWLITYPGIGVHKLSRQLETIFDIRENGTGFTPVTVVNPADKNVWFRSASNEITVFDENWHLNHGPINIAGVSAIKVNDTKQRIWVMAANTLFRYSFTGDEIGNFTVDNLGDFAPIEGDDGAWCITNNGYYLSRFSDSGDIQQQLLVSGFYTGSAAKVYYDPNDSGIWISSAGNSDSFVKADGDGNLLTEVNADDSEIVALNRATGEICYLSDGNPAGIGLVDGDGNELWFKELDGISTAAIDETDGAVYYIAESESGHYLYRATRADGEITHFAGPYSADTFLILATGEVWGE